ncbi:MAG: hypothetical protein ABIV39_19470 [Verrucomicrobiota bacterium]
MKIQLGKFDQLIQILHEKATPDPTLLVEIDRTKVMLLSSWNDYRREKEDSELTK